MSLKPAIAVDLGELFIEEGETESDVMDFHSPPNGWRSSFSGISVDAPGSATGTFTVQVSDSAEDTDVYGTTWKNKQSGGADITVPAGGHVTIKALDWKRLRIKSSATEQGLRRFRIKGIEDAM